MNTYCKSLVHNESKVDKAYIRNREEAIAQMELYGHKSFMFYNAEIDSPSMLYKRFDGYYGVIEWE